MNFSTKEAFAFKKLRHQKCKLSHVNPQYPRILPQNRNHIHIHKQNNMIVCRNNLKPTFSNLN